MPLSIRAQLSTLSESLPTFSQVRETINKHLQKDPPPEEPWEEIGETETITSIPSNTMSINPLCCKDAIPLSYKHLLELLPANTLHNNVPPSRSAGPLIASLLACILNADAIPPALNPEGPFPYTSIFYAVVEVVTLKPTPPQTPSRIPRVSTPTIPSAPSSSSTPVTTISTHYFIPIEERNTPTSTILAAKTPFHCRRWREIRKEEAYETVRRSEMDIVIGDGETWTPMVGTEKLWCEGHGVWCELRAWVRED
ncbi:hypothetical protein GLAREA_06025 [Glarea lozoyensis ATCC 20868]|uniref:Uncharacterized protein n=1 Tax=Glarea lozoyensis (strain ATCC 20868 / MF5171) TaxID=1116229 RepID=S3E3J5_GLAL2|nr:uncharacterized protein GLAREA_06025 [Glarea lozoyensis ATCC 20868]EPE33013.1 hypothetical protein GLAREA_06025 [Glarea lozoyensis ATCC 20868]